MAINKDKNNNLYPAYDTGVKFYASLTREQAKGIQSIGLDNNGQQIFVEPGAVCFVSDSKGNSIFLNNRLFGDGAVAGSGGGVGITEVNLSDIVVIEKDGQVLKTLADYFNSEGQVITESLSIVTTQKDSLEEDQQVSVITINKDGIEIKGSKVTTVSDVESLIQDASSDILSQVQSKADTAELNAKAYADSILTSVYKLKGSVQNYSDLIGIQNPKNGDVYNVVSYQGTIGTNSYVPPGTNYVYVDDGTNRYWDPLGGTIDLSGYISTSDLNNAKKDILESANEYTDQQILRISNDIESIENTVNTLSSDYAGLQSIVQQNIIDIATNAENIDTNTNNITQISTQLTWQ